MTLGRKFLLAFFLIVLPVAGRWAWFNRGWYQPPAIAEIDSHQIAPVQPAHQVVVDQPQPGEGRVIFDLAHANNLAINDLAPLRDRLEARGVHVETFEATSESSLAAQLRGATGLVVAAPTSSYTWEERNLITGFVEDGGRLLLAADPTRPVPIPLEEQDLFTLFFPTSSTPAINSLAHAFGVIYFDDYLYNLTHNEGNYRNVKFTNFNNESPLTQDLDTVVFFASHSLDSEGLALITGDKQTLSPARSGETELIAAALAADEQVLALGDVTFLTPPYHTIADNDRFLNHIADWLARAERRWDLEDFPYLFTEATDMVQMTGDFLDPRLIAGSSELQQVFEQAGLSLTLRATAQPGHDTLFVGTFDDTELVQSYLTRAGITITLVTADTTPEEQGSQGAGELESTTESAEPEPETPVEPTPTMTASLTITAVSEEEEAEAQDRVEIKGLGTVRTTGTSLFVVDRRAGRVVVIALAEDGGTVTAALNRLASGDLSGCIQGDPVTVCSTGEIQDEGGLDASNDDQVSTDTGQGSGRIFILADDDGPEGQRTGATELQTILGEIYDVTLWSTSRDGVPTSDDVDGYDAYIIDTGDYVYDAEDTETLSAFINIRDGSVMFIGEQPFPTFDTEPAALNDLVIANATHPLAAGFSADETITLLASESGVPAMVIPETMDMLSEAEVVFTRGPDSPEAGKPVLIAASDEQTGARVILAGFAFYRLPEEAQRTFALNAAKWLLE